MATKTKSSWTQNDFVDSQCYTAEDKATFINALVAFVLSGFQQSNFTSEIYRHLSNCFQHIAHYDQNGFYATWFADVDKQSKWVDRIKGTRICGDPAYTFSDVEREFQAWLTESDEIDGLLDQNRITKGEEEDKERDRLTALQGATHQTFMVAAKSENTGPFGHRNYVVIAQDGSAFQISIIPHNRTLAVNTAIDVPLEDGRPTWAGFYVETPQRLPNAPQNVIDELWN